MLGFRVWVEGFGLGSGHSRALGVPFSACSYRVPPKALGSRVKRWALGFRVSTKQAHRLLNSKVVG